MPLFARLNKPKQFQYQPRYYDERKARLEDIKRQASADLAAKEETGNFSGLQPGFLAESRANSKLRHSKFEKKSALRFIIILLVILGVLYMISPEMFMAFWKVR